MKRVIILLAAFGIAAALAGILFFRPVKGDKKEGLVLEQYFTVSGIRAKAYGNYLVVYDGDLKIFELNSKTLLKTL
ncbi:MAG: hypothetical protein Q8930_04210, partial [Bacillota bacterium]|nr:hypothetical protein [Bacillota bacterium]